MENTLFIKTYLIYLAIVILLTAFVGRTLFKNAHIFMMDIFKGREEIASATNRLFEVGFYLLNLGFALLILKVWQSSTTYVGTSNMVEVLSYKVGGFSIYLGIMLFLNLFLFFRGKRKVKEATY